LTSMENKLTFLINDQSTLFYKNYVPICKCLIDRTYNTSIGAFISSIVRFLVFAFFIYRYLSNKCTFLINSFSNRLITLVRKLDTVIKKGTFIKDLNLEDEKVPMGEMGFDFAFAMFGDG
jgi:hypothetical protein